MFIGINFNDIDNDSLNIKNSIIKCFLTNSIRLIIFKENNDYLLAIFIKMIK